MNVNLYPKVVAIEAREWLSFLAQAENVTAAAAPLEMGARPEITPPGIAVVRVEGVLLPKVPQWMKDFGLRVTGYTDVADQVRAHASNPSVNEIVMLVDSPGGTVQGVINASAAVREAATRKDVTVWVDGMCASGAYWLACGATRIYAAPTATLGSIGVYQVWYDETARLEKHGITPVVIRSGAMKGMGLDGLTEEQIAAEQENVDALAELFRVAVSNGRGMDPGKTLAVSTGQLWTAERARDAGLADVILETYALGQIVADDEQEIMMTKNKAENAPVEPVETTPEAPPVAVVEDNGEDKVSAERARCASIMNAFAKLDADFCKARMDDGSSLSEAKALWFDHQPPAALKPAPVAIADEGKAHAGADPLESADPPAEKSFSPVAMAKAIQQQEPGISFEAALKRVAIENPERYDEFRRTGK